MDCIEKRKRRKRRRKRSNSYRERVKRAITNRRHRRVKKSRIIRTRRTRFLQTLPDIQRRIAIEFPGYVQLVAPKHFSLVENETKTIEFLSKLKKQYELKHKVFIVLDYVQSLSIDAILVLLSNMVNFKNANIDFNGDRPIDSVARYKLETSGFFDHLYVKDKFRNEYSFKKMNSHIYTHGQKTVASSSADELIKYASEIVWGEPRRCPGAQKTMVELMHNTYDHADENKGGKHWWISVEHDQDNKEVTFSFIDFGVGIFRSIENKKEGDPLFGLKEHFAQFFPFAKTQVEKLRLMLEGKVRLTQTNEYFRGKGLSKIYNHNLENKISSLVIISNYAYANVENQDFHSLDKEFVGTFISWKINKDTYSLKWEI